MQRVPSHKYLYLRGNTYYFRRGVPQDARPAFGKSEVIVSLETSSLPEALGFMQPHIVAFDTVMSGVRERYRVASGAQAHNPFMSAVENLIIAIGMGWDLDGVTQAVIDLLPEGSPCRVQPVAQEGG